MRNFRLYLTLAALIGAALLGSTAARAGGGTDSDSVGPTVLITDLVSNVANLKDSNGIVHPAFVTDPNLVNPWGISESSGSPFWISDNNANVATLYNVPGANTTPVSINPLVVSMPSPGNLLEPSGTPTGTVFNIANPGSAAFQVSGVDKNGQAKSANAIFLFATEDGTILGWNPGVNPPGFSPANAGKYAIIAVDNSANPTAAEGAVYKGLAIATDGNGDTFLYATNFRAGTVEVYDTGFHRKTFSLDAFKDFHVKNGYAPFNIVNADGKLFVTYAVQDALKHDDVAGPAHGIVNTFDLHGGSPQRFTQHGHLNSPWGVVKAPASFGQFAGDILIGNFGNGRINAFDPGTGEFMGTVVNPKGQDILIDGLWTLTVGNGGNGGSANTVYFTAGPNGEQDGLFGSLTAVAPGTPCGPTCI
jgi:uncharacterized protein (TIGR03118 family)